MSVVILGKLCNILETNQRRVIEEHNEKFSGNWNISKSNNYQYFRFCYIDFAIIVADKLSFREIGTF